jgi:hypothetical protein
VGDDYFNTGHLSLAREGQASSLPLVQTNQSRWPVRAADKTRDCYDMAELTPEVLAFCSTAK